MIVLNRVVMFVMCSKRYAVVETVSMLPPAGLHLGAVLILVSQLSFLSSTEISLWYPTLNLCPKPHLLKCL